MGRLIIRGQLGLGHNEHIGDDELLNIQGRVTLGGERLSFHPRFTVAPPAFAQAIIAPATVRFDASASLSEGQVTSYSWELWRWH